MWHIMTHKIEWHCQDLETFMQKFGTMTQSLWMNTVRNILHTFWIQITLLSDKYMLESHAAKIFYLHFTNLHK